MSSMRPYQILLGDALTEVSYIPAQSVQCIVTSPPYYKQRDYNVVGQLGQESTVDKYVTRLVDVFHGARRVLKDDGVLWLNIGDSYFKGQLQGVPWRVALALQNDGWYLRQDIIWHKPNPLPESVKTRCTKSHEYIFLFSKSNRHYYNADAIAEPIAVSSRKRYQHAVDTKEKFDPTKHKHTAGVQSPMELLTRAAAGVLAKGTRNRRSVWKMATQSFTGAHFATFPVELPTLCIKAGSRPGDVILDPFSGAGTTGAAAISLGREYIGIELNREYRRNALDRLETCYNDIGLDALS